jgi:hypothetical protein
MSNDKSRKKFKDFMDPKLSEVYEKKLEKLNLELINEQDKTKRKEIEERIQALTEEKDKISS